MTKLPTHLKCSLTGKILEDAVVLPCCGKAVSDLAIRSALIGNNLQCPLCSQRNVSPDELKPQENLRKATEVFIVEANAASKADGSGIDISTHAQDSLLASAAGALPAMVAAAMPMSALPMPFMDPYMMMGFPMPGMMGPGMMVPGMMAGMPPNLVPGPYPGLVVDSFTGQMLPFDPSLVPWDLLPPELFPPALSFEEFTREKDMQMEFKRRSSRDVRSPDKFFERDKHHPSVEYSKYNPPPSSSTRSTITTCQHGRTAGYCKDCEPEKFSEKPKEAVPKVVTCQHGRTAGYCKDCEPEKFGNESFGKKTRDRDGKRRRSPSPRGSVGSGPEKHRDSREIVRTAGIYDSNSRNEKRARSSSYDGGSRSDSRLHETMGDGLTADRSGDWGRDKVVGGGRVVRAVDIDQRVQVRYHDTNDTSSTGKQKNSGKKDLREVLREVKSRPSRR